MNPWQPPPASGFGPHPGPYGQQQYPYAQPGYPPPGPPPQRPGGGTAITAAVLSFLAVPVHGLIAIASVRDAGGGYYRTEFTVFFVCLALVSFAIAVALLIGGITLLTRRSAGRVLIVIACAGAMVLEILLLGYAQVIQNGHWFSGGRTAVAAAIFGVAVTVVLGVPILIFALVPATKRWCLARQPGTPPPPPAW